MYDDRLGKKILPPEGRSLSDCCAYAVSWYVMHDQRKIFPWVEGTYVDDDQQELNDEKSAMSTT